jgi:hypothetical protein
VSEKTVCRRFACTMVAVACVLAMIAIMVADPKAKAESVLAVGALISIIIAAGIVSLPA